MIGRYNYIFIGLHKYVIMHLAFAFQIYLTSIEFSVQRFHTGISPCADSALADKYQFLNWFVSTLR